MSSYPTNPGDASVAEIERAVDHERGQVSETIDALQSKISVNGLFDEVVKAVSEHGGDISRNLGRTVRDNPLPLILTGVGLAWLMASSSQPEARGSRSGSHRYDEGWKEWERLRRSGATRDRSESSASPAFAGEGVQRVFEAGGDETTSGNDESSAGWDAGSAVRDAGGAARDAAGELSEKARDALGRAGDSVSEAREGLAEAGQRAREWGEERSRGMRKGFDSMLEDQPLALGALALAIGAALGGALPRTRAEDELIGAQADRLKQSAAGVLRAEGEKAGSVVGAVADEAMKIVDEAAGELAHRVPDGAAFVEKAKNAALSASDRLKTVAEEEAKKQNLGAVDPATSESDQR